MSETIIMYKDEIGELKSRVSDLERRLEELADPKVHHDHQADQQSEPELIQGYTIEQWQLIIDGGFLCEFADTPFEGVKNNVVIDYLRKFVPGRHMAFHRQGGMGWVYCRPLRTKGVRQPWFGGDCPVGRDDWVLVCFRDGIKDHCKAHKWQWSHDGGFGDIIEFIEL